MTTNPLRIVHVAATTNGAPWMLDLMREQRRRGHEVQAIIPPGPGTIPAILREEGFSFSVTDLDVIARSTRLSAAGLVIRLARLLRGLRADVVQYHLFPSIVAGRFAAWIADVPLRFSMIPGTYYLEAPTLGRIETGTAWTDTRVIATCERTRTLYLKAGVPSSLVEVFFYGVDPVRFDPAAVSGSAFRDVLGVHQEALVVGLVALFYPRMADTPYTPPYLVGRDLKGRDVLIRAVPEVLEEFPEARFLLIGGPWGAGGDALMEEMRSLARELGVESSVVLAGYQNDVPASLAALDVALQCSLCENLGGSIEALMMERPLIVTNVGGLVDSVKHGRTGLVVPPDDPAALAQAIRRLLRDRAFATRLGKNGRAFMLDSFTVSRLADSLDALYARCISEDSLDSMSPCRSRYRLVVSVLRLAMLPFRIGAVVLGVIYERRRRELDAVKRRNEASAPLKTAFRGAALRWRRFRDWVQHVLESPLRLLLRLRKPLRRNVSKSGPLRVAQIVGSSIRCEWLIGIAGGLRDRGYDVCAIVDTAEGDLPQRLEAAGIRTFRLPMTFARRYDRLRLLAYLVGIPTSAFRLAALLRRERFDVAHSHIFASIMITRLACALAGTPRHVSMIPGPRHLEARLTRIADRLSQSLDDATVAGSRFTLEIYNGMRIDHGSLRCIYYGADERLFDPSPADNAQARATLGIAADVPVIGLVAQFYPPTRGPQNPLRTRGVGLKGHETFLAAARIVRKQFPDGVFLLVGGGHGKEGEAYRLRLRDECTSGDLREAVRFTGFVPDVRPLLAAMDVAVQCSLTENLGGTVEALLMARPTVATRVGGMPESVLHEETGLLVPAGNPTALADAIVRLLIDHGLAAKLGRNGRRRMLDRFTLTRTVDDIVALYHDLGVPAGRSHS